MANPIVTISDMVGHIRDWIGQPHHDDISNESVLMRLQRKLDHYRNNLDVTDQNWLLSSWDLNVDTHSEQRIVNAVAFGRPVECYTIDNSDPNHIRRYPRIVSIQDFELYYQGSVKNTGDTGVTSPHVAACFAFYKEFTTLQTMVRWLPIHSIACTYRFWYTPSRLIPVSLTDTLGFVEQFANLMEVDTALDCLIEMKTMPTEEYNRREKRLLTNQAVYHKTFVDYTNQDKQEKVVRRRQYGDGVDDAARGMPMGWL